MRKLALLAPIVLTGCLAGGTTNIAGNLVVEDEPGSSPACTIATSAGEVCIEGDLEADGNLNIAGTSTLTGATSITGDAAVGGTLTVTGAQTLTGATSMTSALVTTLTQADLGATCTVGWLRIDTASTKELCYCQATNVWYCWSATTVTGPTD
jgi:hypothetical protein